MITVLVIGAGGIGMRHLQSVATLGQPFACWAVDPSEGALQRAKQLLDTTAAASAFHYVQSLEQAPAQADVAVVATSSRVRAKVVADLLAREQIRYLVLEKFLFPCEAEYGEIGALMTEKGIPCWVNTPRGMYPGWQTVMDALQTAQGPLHYTLVGGAWGLGCNAIHYVDMLDRLLGGGEAFAYDLSGLDNTLCPSKRDDYVEFTGTLRVFHPRAAEIQLVAQRSTAMWPLQTLWTDTLRFVISEPEQRAWRATQETGWKMEELAFPIRFQSQLTGPVIEQLLATGDCPLTPYKRSAALHIPLLRALLGHYNAITGKSDTLCPIT